MRAEKKCKWLRPLRPKSDGFGAGISAHDLELEEDHMATKAMNLNAGLEAADAGQDERHNSRSLAGRQAGVGSHCSASALVIFFAHGAQKMFGWFGGYGWNGTMQYFTQSLHIPAPLAAVVILVELLGGLALLAAVFTRWTAILERGILSSGW